MSVYAWYGLGVGLGVGVHLALSRTRAPVWLRWVAPAPFAAALVVLLAIYSEPPPRQLFEDFHEAYLSAARTVLQNPSRLYQGYSHGFVNIPIVALPFVPLAMLTPKDAQQVYLLLGLMVVGMTWAAQKRLLQAPQEVALVLAALFLINGPLYNSLREGNSTHLLLGLLVAALLSLRAGHELRAGALLAVCGVVKLPLLLLGAPFVLRGRWRVATGFAAGLAGLVGLSLLIFGLELHQAWWSQIIAPSSGKPVGAFNVQSIDGFLARALTGGRHLRDWAPIQGLGFEFTALRWLSIAGFTGAAGWVCWRAGAPRSQRGWQIEVCVALCLALLVSPISWTHYYLLLLLPLGLCLVEGERLPGGWIGATLLWLSVALISLPVRPVTAKTPWLRELMSQWLISHYVFGAALLLALLLALRWFAAREAADSEASPA
jgi:alpha-1,2-mannosyltransferase